LISFFFSSRRRHTRWPRDWSSDVCSSDLAAGVFTAGFTGDLGRFVYVATGFAAGATYYAVNMGLLSMAVAIEGHQRWFAVFRERSEERRVGKEWRSRWAWLC